MRHAKTIKKLGRTHAHRQATMAALSSALIRNKRITTTLAKAKALRGWVEPILHRSRTDTTHSRRLAFRDLGSDKEAVKVLFDEISGAIGDRPGGYTRVVKLGQRAGDAAEMAIIELVDFNDVRPDGAASGRRKTRRSRRSGKGGADAGAAGTATGKAPATKATAGKAGPDDFTRLRGIGPVMAEALRAAGITTFNQLAKAELQTLRDAIEEHTQVVEENVNEETWSAQAELAAAGDWEGLEALIGRLDTGEGIEGVEGVEGEEGVGEVRVEGGDEGVGNASETGADVVVEDEPAPEDAIAQVSDIPTDEPEPDDAVPGNAGEGPPPPEADTELRGRSKDRG